MRVYLKKYRNAIVYALTIVFSLVYIILGNRIASRNFYFGSVSTLEYSARVLRVVDIQEENYTLSGTDNQIDVYKRQIHMLSQIIQIRLILYGLIF